MKQKAKPKLQLNFNFEKLLSFFDPPTEPLIGVDISANSIKFVELNFDKKNQTYALTNYTIDSTPADAFDSNGVIVPEIMGAALKKSWKNLGTRVKNIAIALPINTTTFKNLRLSNNLNDQDIENELNIPNNSNLGYPLDEVNFDWEITGPSKLAPEEDNDVSLYIARKDKIDEYVSAAEMAGLNLKVVDIENYTQLRAMQHIMKNKNMLNKVVALIDAGFSSTKISVYQNGESIYYKETPFGANQLIDSIQNNCSCDKQTAINILKNNGSPDSPNYASDIAKPFLESFAFEINRSLQFFLTQGNVDQVDNVFITGGGASIAHSTEVIYNIINIPTEIANPFEGMTVSPKMKNISKDITVLLAATGLAFRKFD